MTKIRGGVVTVVTDYAGEINVKQAMVTSITTDHPVAVKVAGGTEIIGMVTPAKDGGIKIDSPTNSITTPVAKVLESWTAGEEDPDVVALRRKWSFEAGVDITGSGGTHTQLGTAFTYHAKLAGPEDTFQYYANYLRQETDGVVSADQFKAGVDYADNFTPLSTWYARDEAGFDRIQDISFYDVAATGYGYNFVKDKDQLLTGRVGVSYRYDEYSARSAATLSAAGADFELEYTKNFKNSKFHDRIALVPAFEDLGNYIITHEFAYELPLAKSLWKLSIGMTNNFDSRPVDDTGRLETIYFVRLVLAWGEGQPQPTH